MERRLVLGLVVARQTVDVLDGDRQTRVREHPERDETRAERPVLVVHRRLLDDLLHLELRERARHGVLEVRIEVLLVPCGFLDDGLLGLALLGRDRRQRFRLVAALGTPRDIVQVAEGVDVEDVGEAWRQAQVLEETGEHVPWVALNRSISTERTETQAPNTHVEERGDEVDAERRDGGRDESTNGTAQDCVDDLSSILPPEFIWNFLREMSTSHPIHG